jgi:hypothetical protein
MSRPEAETAEEDGILRAIGAVRSLGCGGAGKGLPARVARQARPNRKLDVPHDYSAGGAAEGLPVVWVLPDA